MKTKFVIICMLMILLFGCATKVTTKPFGFVDYKNAYENVNPTRYLRVTEIYSEEILLSRETKEHIKDNQVTYEKIISEVVSATLPTMTSTTKEYYYKGNKLWEKTGDNWVSVSGGEQAESALRFNQNYFDNISITKTDSGSELIAEVKQDMASIFLQENPPFARDVKVKIMEENRRIVRFVLSYNSQDKRVITTVNYFYTQYTIPVNLQVDN